MTLEEIKKSFEQAKKTGNEGWLGLELLLYIAEKLDRIDKKTFAD